MYNNNCVKLLFFEYMYEWQWVSATGTCIPFSLGSERSKSTVVLPLKLTETAK